MGLTAYRQQCQRLLRDTRQVQFNLQDLDVYINEARVQIALAAECIRQPAELALTTGQQSYRFDAMTFTAAPTIPLGLGGVANVRVAFINLITGGRKRLSMKAWEWFDSYFLALTAPVPGIPTTTSRLQPGTTAGTLWFAPAPDQDYTASIDAVAYPAPLVSDADPDALPAPWTDAVPFFSAYYAMLSVGDKDGADDMFEMYQRFEQRGTQLTTPTRNPRSFPGGRGAGIVSQRIALTGPPPPPASQRQVVPQG